MEFAWWRVWPRTICELGRVVKGFTTQWNTLETHFPYKERNFGSYYHEYVENQSRCSITKLTWYEVPPFHRKKLDSLGCTNHMGSEKMTCFGAPHRIQSHRSKNVRKKCESKKKNPEFGLGTMYVSNEVSSQNMLVGKSHIHDRDMGWPWV